MDTDRRESKEKLKSIAVVLFPQEQSEDGNHWQTSHYMFAKTSFSPCPISYPYPPLEHHTKLHAGKRSFHGQTIIT